MPLDSADFWLGVLTTMIAVLTVTGVSLFFAARSAMVQDFYGENVND